jgi:hypothetical protein
MLIVVMAILTLVGCATSATTHAVRGLSGIEVDCFGLGSGWGEMSEASCQRMQARRLQGGDEV